MQGKPLFSVIIPTYNTGKIICKTLDSLVAQTYKNFEVIISDDGSTDDTLFYVKTYLASLNIKILANENWGGPARPRNLGIKVASSDWLAFLDHDDFWERDKLEVILKYLNDYDVIFHDLKIYTVNKKTNKTVKGQSLGSNPFIGLMTGGNAIPNSSAVVRKSLVEEVDYIDETRELVTVEDYDLWLKISRKTNRFYYVNKSLGSYFLLPGQNMSSASEKKINTFNYIYNKYEVYLSEIEKREARAVLNYSKARIYHKILKDEEARKNYKLALFSNKWNIRFKSLAGLILLFFKKH